MVYAAALIASYLLGAIPFGVIAGKLARGIDIPGTQMSNPKPVLSVRTK